MTLQGCRVYLLLLWACFQSWAVHAQIDPEKRRLIQLGYNQPLESRGPIAGYGFFYYNRPNFVQTNLTLRLTVAPIYLDSELGFTGLLGPNTDFGLGIAGGGFADSYSEVRDGVYRRNESFIGHGGEISSSIYHRLNPGKQIPLWALVRAGAHQSIYVTDNATDPSFVLPDDRTELSFRTGLRYGGQEPELTAPLAMELSAWYEVFWRSDSGRYGFSRDRVVQDFSHLFWGRGLFKYTFDPSAQSLETSLTMGASLEADRFSAYRLGGFLPFTSEFPLNLPGYFFQELSADRFVLLNAQYSIPLLSDKTLSFTTFAGTAAVDYLSGLEQSGNWHSGAGAGLSWTSPSETWLVSLVYAHGFDAKRGEGRGANSLGLLLQYDFEARKGKGRFSPGVSPYKSRGGERFIFE